MDKYQCLECSYIYNEAEGDMRVGLASGTRWEEIDEDFYCPDCGVVGKGDFVKVA